VPSDTIVVLTASTLTEPGVPRVVAALQRRGRRVVCLDSAGFPLDASVRIELDGGAWLGADPVLAGEVSAVWYRHLDVAGALGDDRLDATWRPAVERQSELAIWAFLMGLPGLHVDHPERADLVPGSPGILRLARAAGLDVPRTLVSNSPSGVREFVASCPGGAIRKLIHSSSIRIVTDDGAQGGATEAVSLADLEDDASIAACPLVWQERVPKARELRITAVGRELFVGSIDSTASESGAVDWRRDPSLVRAFAPDTLPASVEAAVHRLLDRLRLNFATLDIIRTPDGRHVLLEVNTVSYFDFLEDATGLPISDAIAGLLAGERPARVPEG
jgi:hypothetical protein